MLVFGQIQPSLKETNMAFKEYDRKPTFLDMEIQRAETFAQLYKTTNFVIPAKAGIPGPICHSRNLLAGIQE